jgi:fatty acid desaturase
MNYESGGSKDKKKSSFLQNFADSILIEFAFWIFAGLVWIAFYGGTWGIVISLILGSFLALIFWGDLPNKSQHQENND